MLPTRTPAVVVIVAVIVGAAVSGMLLVGFVAYAQDLPVRYVVGAFVLLVLLDGLVWGRASSPKNCLAGQLPNNK